MSVNHSSNQSEYRTKPLINAIPAVKTVNTTIESGDLAPVLPVVGTAGNVNCTSIAAGTAGQIMILYGTDDTNTVTLNGSTANLRLKTGVTSVILNNGEAIYLIYITTNSLNKWCQL